MVKKKESMDWHRIGHYSFIVGIIVAVIVPFIPVLNDAAIYLMVLLGIIVGLMNISAKEFNSFLIASVALMIASATSAQTIASIWYPLIRILGNILIFVAPAAIIVSLKVVYALAEK